ncbi:MAG: molybdopterin molybdotransferase MoeA [Archangium sp.]|nr:molybdopterin molybdotransferase MoeA [Archangium sp.]
MLTVEETLARVLEAVPRLEAETAPIAAAIGRILTGPVHAARTLPPWDNSAMDGYAIRHGDAPGRLAVVDAVYAGDRPQRPLSPGECARIQTGAPLPPGADAIVPQEHARRTGDHIQLDAPVSSGAFVRLAGEDTRAGALLLSAGTRVGLAEAAALWAQGATSVQVPRRPSVAIASSGDELAPVGSPPSDRLIDTNTPMIARAVELTGGRATPLGLAADRLDAVTDVLARGLTHDVLITVSGASVGDRDFTRPALTALGVSIEAWKVAMKPGKPFTLGRRGTTVVFGLPGNPVSALVTFELFVRPALRAMQGLSPGPPRLTGRLATAATKPAGLAHFLRASVTERDGALWATPTATQSSGALSSALGATHLIVLPENATEVPEGASISLIPLSWANEP